ncbi:MAG TPA: hypothetical protein VNE42_07595 [Acidimicrobiales bacterium]|nr:hypothetical protein [Acidimicrobiales bacterium]
MAVPTSNGGPFIYQPEMHYGARAKFQVYIVAGGSTGDFLQRTKELLDELQLRHVVYIWVGDKSVFSALSYRVNTNNRHEDDNLSGAFDASLVAVGGSTDNAGVSAHGFGSSFETELRLAFHLNKIEVEVLALPIELSWKEDEDLVNHIDRFNQFFDDKKALEGKNEQAETSFQGYLERLSQSLTKAFGATEVSYHYKVDLSSIVW